MFPLSLQWLAPTPFCRWPRIHEQKNSKFVVCHHCRRRVLPNAPGAVLTQPQSTYTRVLVANRAVLNRSTVRREPHGQRPPAIGHCHGDPQHTQHTDPAAIGANKNGSLERMNSIGETDGNIGSCNPWKRLRPRFLHEIDEFKLPFVSLIESNLSVLKFHFYLLM